MIKIELEYLMNCSSRLLFNRLSTPNGLSEWFADDVILKDNIFTFKWKGHEEQAEILSKKELSFIRFHWLTSQNEESYFEFRIHEHELTNESSLIVIDYIDDDDDKEAAIELWETHISNLKYILGA